MSDHPALLTEAELMHWLGYSQRSRLEDRLRQLGVPIIYGRGERICTTLGALEAALGVRPAERRQESTPDFA
jgi:hypothetical protein